MMVRDAIAQDAAAIAAIWNPVIETGTETFNSVLKSADDVRTMIEGRPCFLVIELDGAVVGFATYDQFRGGVGYARTMEHTIILAPAAAGRGAGRALMDRVLDHAKANGVHSMWAGVSGENANAVAFHKACGFVEVATLLEVGWKFDRWFDLVLLQKRL